MPTYSTVHEARVYEIDESDGQEVNRPYPDDASSEKSTQINVSIALRLLCEQAQRDDVSSDREEHLNADEPPIDRICETGNPMAQHHCDDSNGA